MGSFTDHTLNTRTNARKVARKTPTRGRKQEQEGQRQPVQPGARGILDTGTSERQQANANTRGHARGTTPGYLYLELEVAVTARAGL